MTASDALAGPTATVPPCPPALAITGLSHVYPDGTRALDDVTLAAGPGVLGLLGPNGAGKSSLMRSLATLQVPTAGSVRFDDVDGVAEPERLRRTLGYLPQEFGVYPGVSVRTMLDHMAVLKGLADRRARRDAVDAMLARVNLWAARGRELRTVSGGMRRRFGLAQALLGSPRLLLLDEPSAGLDPEERHRLLDLVAEAGERAVVLLSTHLVEEAAAVCSRVAVLADGRIRLDGAPADLLAPLRGRVWRRAVDRADANATPSGATVVSARLLSGRTVLRVLADAPPPGFKGAEPGLEDVYLATVRASRQPPGRHGRG